MIRIYFSAELQVGRQCMLPESQAHHAVRVLRLKAGDAVVLFNGDGSEYSATISQASRDRVALDVTGRTAVDRESPLQVTLAQAISSGERMDYTVQKAVELGIAVIQPITAERSVVRLQGERATRRVQHWQSVVAASCEQCGRNRLPQVRPLVAFESFLAAQVGQGDALRLMLSPHSTRDLRALDRPAVPIVLLAGAEGGFSTEEEHAAEHVGFLPVRLGPRVLRTETAAVAALAAMQAWWGDF
ncbi:MAG TPA: 16S rRNA (uracil(1498)-N(3))-methyltransferase [Burkholderiales bacterium]|nr:16S rRNA (uracil(1498)-N(3))-methyltransferase [Burkholderiales bacterium]